MEIERKYLVNALPNIKTHPYHIIEQAYLNINPVIRIRRQNDSYYLTYKGDGLMIREEYNMPLDRYSYNHLLEKADGHLISKRRYILTDVNELTIELDVFDKLFKGLVLAEVEFQSEEDAQRFTPPDWFGKEVTFDGDYHNSRLSRLNPDEIDSLLKV